MDIEESMKSFAKIIGLAIGLLICTIGIAVVLGIIQSVLWGWSPGLVAARAGVNSATSIALAVVMLVLAIIGKTNTTKNGIMAFVFGIITLVCAAGIIGDRSANVGGWIENLVGSAMLIPDPEEIVEVVLRIVQLAFFAVIIALSITSIITSVNIIKVTKDATTSTTVASTTARSQPQPTMSSQPVTSGVRAQFCSSCGAPVDASAQFCNKCGAKV